jgi:hypothetical protein
MILMDYRPSSSFIALMSAFAVCGIAGAWGWSRINSVPGHIRLKGDLWEMLTYEPKPVFEPLSAEEIAENKVRADEIKAALVASYPELALDTRSVPAERNGFLRLHILTGNGERPQANFSKEMLAAMKDKAPWDMAEIKTLLEQHQTLIRELREIGGLTERSAAEMPEDYTGFISARESRNFGKLLLLSAKVAALEGDADSALRDVKCVSTMAAHYREVEGSNLLMTTVAILLDGMVRSWILEEIVPALRTGADLQPWRDALATRPYDGKDLSHALRGEWHHLASQFVLPVVLRDRPDSPPDGGKLMEFFADEFAGAVQQTASLPLSELRSLRGMNLSEYSHLSKKSREIAGLITIGWAKWGNGVVREAVRQQMGLAAMDLIILERSGSGAVDAGVMERLPRNPLDGEPFHYDPATRTVSLPAEDAGWAMNVPR